MIDFAECKRIVMEARVRGDLRLRSKQDEFIKPPVGRPLKHPIGPKIPRPIRPIKTDITKDPQRKRKVSSLYHYVNRNGLSMVDVNKIYARHFLLHHAAKKRRVTWLSKYAMVNKLEYRQLREAIQNLHL